MMPDRKMHVRHCRRAMEFSIMAALTGVAMAAPAVAQDKACAPDADKAAVETVVRWQAGLVRADPAELASLYGSDGLIVDRMMGNGEHRGQRSIAAFYSGFLQRHPAADARVTSIMPGCNRVEATGTVLIRLAGVRKGTRNLLDGRFDVVLEHKDARWQLTRHDLQLATRPNRAVVETTGRVPR